MFIGLDLGTTNIKALLTDDSGSILAQGAASVSLHHIEDDGVEQDIENIWSATLAALRQLGESRSLSDVRSIGISAQGGAMQMLNRDGQPLGRVISWLDNRGRKYDEILIRKMGADWFAAHTGCARTHLAVGQIARLREESPDILKPPNRIGFVGDVIVSRLCGTGAHDTTSLSIAGFYNPSLRCADPDVLQLLDLHDKQLPRLVSVKDSAGGLLDTVAAETGLPVGIPVSPAVHDQYASALGAGVTRSGDVMVGTGTAWVLLASTARMAKPACESAFICTHVVDGLYGQMLSLANGGSAFSWVVHLLGLSEKNSGELDALMESVIPGSDGLRFWPLLIAGGGVGLTPGTRGRLAGVQLSHGPAHILRAVVEGLACELARYLEMLKTGGIELQRLILCGGAAASRVTPQIIADVTGLPVTCATESAMSAHGAAVLARGLVEKDTPLEVLSGQMAHPTQTLTPGNHADFYRKLFETYTASLPRT